MKKITAALALIMMAGSAFAAKINQSSPAVKLIDQVSKGQLVVKQVFPATANLEGFVVQPKQGGREAVLFADKSGRYVIAGNVLTAKGQNLTEQATKTYIQAKVAKKAYAEAEAQHWISQGSDKAPHKAYIIIDPNCIFCHMLFEEIEPMIKSGDLQVRWIPAGFLKPSSPGKAASIMLAKTDQDRVKALFNDEHHFNKKAEEGGAKDLKPDPKNKAVTQAFAAVKANTEFFSKFGFQGTPTILYRTANGEPAVYPGYLNGSALKQLVAKMNAKW